VEYGAAAAIAPSRWRPTPARLARLVAGLWIFGTGEALLIASDLGNSPWTVFSQGFGEQLDISVGLATILTSAAILLVWIPLRQAPGLGTVLNAIVIGVAIDVTLGYLPDSIALGPRIAFVPVGIALVAFASGVYLTTRLGPGPRDGLMTGLHRRTGLSLRVVRVAIEVFAVAAGVLLGGVAGVGTAAFALLIGPAVQFWVHRIGGTETHTL
jgi:uncharacterized membrane protein YczE